ncbi:hypothetical protein MCAMS1_00469 [biofilm metagenome]
MELSYKPTTTTFHCTTEQLQIVLQGDAFQHTHVMGIVTHETTTDSDLFAKIIPISKDATKYYQSLNDALLELDQAHLDLILVELPPETEEWRAVNERLREMIQPLVEARPDWDTLDTAIAGWIAYDLFFD